MKLPVSQAVDLATKLEACGLEFSDEAVMLIAMALSNAQGEARREERQRIYALWLVEVLPGDVIRMAAEKVASKEF